MTADATDLWHMRAALALARRSLGQAAPNPAVGCVLVNDGRVVGRGRTGRGGRPHAETEALAQAGAKARGATAYVTLEPCRHHGQTPPCSSALVAAGVTRVQVAMEDPDPRVCGRGIRHLKEQGLAVDIGLCAQDAASLAAGFLMRLKQGRPRFTLKLATSLDGRIATRLEDSRWITGPLARRYGHILRAEHDAVLTGIGTVIHDDPALSCRIAGLEDRSPIRVVLDSTLRLAPDSDLVRSARERPLWVVCAAEASTARRSGLENLGVRVFSVAADADGRPELAMVARLLGEQGMTSVLVECGARLAGAFVRAGLADTLAWFRAGRLIGDDGLSVVAGLGVDKLPNTPYFLASGGRDLAPDCVEFYKAAE